MTDKSRGFSYYIKRCEEIDFDSDLFDYDKEIGSDLSYSEIITQLEDTFFSNLQTLENLKLKQEVEEQKLRVEQYEREAQTKKNIIDKGIIRLFNEPKIISVCADINQGKSMLLYHILETLKKKGKFDLYTYGLRLNFLNSQEIFSVVELEQVKNSIIVIDELSSLFDLDNRKIKKLIENTLRLLNHNNNILILCGTPENFKKFISAKVDYVIYKKSTFSDFINGSKIKNMLMSYKGNERGSEILNLAIDEALVYDGTHYNKINVPYYKKYDSKRNNKEIIVPKIVRKNVQKKC